MDEQHECGICGEVFNDKLTHNCDASSPTALIGTGAQFTIPPENAFKLLARAHSDALLTFSHNFTEKFLSLDSAFEHVKDDVIILLETLLKQYGPFKAKFLYHLKMLSLKSGESSVRYFHSNYMLLTHANFIATTLDFGNNYISSVIDLVNQGESGHTIERVQAFEIHVGRYKGMAAAYLPIPVAFRKRRGYRIIKCTASCFMYCIVSALYGDRIRLFSYPDSSYEQLTYSQRQCLRRKLQKPNSYTEIIADIRENGLLDFEGFEDKVAIEDLNEFEARNNVSISVYGFTETEIIPLRLTTLKAERHVTLLFVDKENLTEDEQLQYSNIEGHFVLVTNPSMFFTSKTHNKMLVCRFCGSRRSAKRLEKHESSCHVVHSMALKVPKDDIPKASGLNRFMSPPYIMAAELLPIQVEDGPIQIGGYALHGIGPQMQTEFFRDYVGTDALHFLIEDMFIYGELLMKKTTTNKLALRPTLDEIERRRVAKTCLICLQDYTPQNYAVLHHDHYDKDTPIRILCNNCNINIQPAWYTPLIINQASNIFLKQLILAIKQLYKRRIIITPKKDGFLSITVPNVFRIIAVESFLDSHLEDLLRDWNIPENAMYFGQLHRRFPRLPRALYFPHCIFESLDQIHQCALPRIFFDIYLKRNVTEDESMEMHWWFDAHCFTMERYAKFWMTYRLLAFTGVMLSLNSFLMKIFEQGILYDVSLSSYAYGVALQKSRCRFHYMKQPSIVKLVNESLIGPISHVSMRYADAKAEILGHNDILDSERRHLLFADVISTYAYVMSMNMPFSNYELVSDLDQFDMDMIKVDGETSYYLCVDLHYPDSIKDFTADFPLVATKEYVARGLDLPNKETATHHVLLTQHDKIAVPMHAKSLIFFQEQGMILTKVHWIISFKQRPWLRPMMAECLQAKKEAKHKFHASVLKSCQNRIYGKMFEIENQVNMYFCDSKRQAENYIKKENFVSVDILSDDLSLFHMRKPKRLLTKNILAANVIIDLARLHIYKCVYELKRHFSSRMIVCGIEVDSLSAVIYDKENTYFEEIKKHFSHLFDCSTLPDIHPLKSNLNAGEPGRLRFELAYPEMYVKLKSKVYAYSSHCEICAGAGCDICSRTGKNIAIKGSSHHKFEDYITALSTEVKGSKIKSLKSTQWSATVVEKQSVVLRKTICKSRVFAKDNITSLPLGHPKLSNGQYLPQAEGSRECDDSWYVYI